MRAAESKVTNGDEDAQAQELAQEATVDSAEATPTNDEETGEDQEEEEYSDSEDEDEDEDEDDEEDEEDEEEDEEGSEEEEETTAETGVSSSSPVAAALRLSQSVSRGKKRQRSVFGSTAEEIWGPKTSRKRAKGSRRKKLPHHIRTLLGDATEQYMFKEYRRAKATCERIIKENSSLSEPFHILGGCIKSVF